MMRKTLLPLLAVAIAGCMAACTDNNDANEYTTLDREWDSLDNAFTIQYIVVKNRYDSLQQSMAAMPAANDSSTMASRATAQTRLDEQRMALEKMDQTRTTARQNRDAARTANNRADYDAARKEVDYVLWFTDLDRMRNEQNDIEGMMRIGNAEVGAIDMHVEDTSKPLIRVEPGENDNDPLIEKNKNP